MNTQSSQQYDSHNLSCSDSGGEYCASNVSFDSIKEEQIWRAKQLAALAAAQSASLPPSKAQGTPITYGQPGEGGGESQESSSSQTALGGINPQTGQETYITPPTRNPEQLEYRTAWFDPPKKKKVKRRRYMMHSPEIPNVSRKLDFTAEVATTSSMNSDFLKFDLHNTAAGTNQAHYVRNNNNNNLNEFEYYDNDEASSNSNSNTSSSWDASFDHMDVVAPSAFLYASPHNKQQQSGIEANSYNHHLQQLSLQSPVPNEKIASQLQQQQQQYSTPPKTPQKALRTPPPPLSMSGSSSMPITSMMTTSGTSSSNMISMMQQQQQQQYQVQPTPPKSIKPAPIVKGAQSILKFR